VQGYAQRLKITETAVDDREALHCAIGDGVKRLEANETNTVIVQRRAICAARALPRQHALAANDLVVLRPCPPGALPPYRWPELVGRRLRRDLAAGENVLPGDVEG